MISKPDISIVIPFLNEEESIPLLVNSLNEYLKTLEQSFEVVFVDDGSTDDSIQVLKRSGHNSYRAKIVKLSKNYGSILALSAGIQNTSADLVTFQFADLQDPLELLPQLYSKYKEGNDIVWACRNKANEQNPFFSRMYGNLMRKYAVSNFPNNGFDIAFFNKKVKDELIQNVEKNSSIFLQILDLGFKQDYIYYDKKDRKAGKSKWSFAKKFKLVVDSFVAYSYAPIRLVTVAGVLFALAGFLWMAYIIFYDQFIEDLPLGLPALLCVLLVGFGVTNISLGIIAEYLWRTLDVSRQRKAFVIDEVIQIDKL